MSTISACSAKAALACAAPFASGSASVTAVVFHNSADVFLACL